jgi:hypothetical protein
MLSRPLRWFAGLVGGLLVLSLVSLFPINGGRASEAQLYSMPPSAQEQPTSQIQDIQNLISRVLGIS